MTRHNYFVDGCPRAVRPILSLKRFCLFTALALSLGVTAETAFAKGKKPPSGPKSDVVPYEGSTSSGNGSAPSHAKQAEKSSTESTAAAPPKQESAPAVQTAPAEMDKTGAILQTNTPAHAEKPKEPLFHDGSIAIEGAKPGVKESAEESSSPAQPLPPSTAAEETPNVVPEGSKIVTVWIWQETRDCLWNLAKQNYGDPWKWKKIYMANRNTILDPGIIFPKQQIVIPPETNQ